jgi:sulfate/thiosulfate transport system ATP-binding protein
MAIEIAGITKRFGSFTALDDVDLTVEQGELLALLGPSGSGKTTLLRIIAGLEFADAGDIRMYGETTQGRAPRDRQVGFVFQHYALFRHMTVFENIAFGLRVRPRPERKSNAAIAARVHELLRMMQLDWLADRYPWQLSGGQRQRVALARAMAIEPKLLLLDEPFGALDAKVRKELRRWLRRLHEEIHITSVFVTHDQEEALELADRVVVMNQGRIEQVGSPSEVYDHPASAFVCDFLGEVNRFECEVRDGVAVTKQGAALRIPGLNGGDTGPVTCFVRPHEIDLVPLEGEGVEAARVRLIHQIGPHAHVELDLAGHVLEVEIDRHRLPALGLIVGAWCAVRINHARVFPR